MDRSRALLLILLLWPSLASAEQIYTWTDAAGVRHFSKVPPADGGDSNLIDTTVRNPSIQNGEGKLPRLTATARCDRERMAHIDQELIRLEQDFKTRMQQCDQQRQRSDTSGGFTDCQRYNRLWYTEAKANFQRALNACLGK